MGATICGGKRQRAIFGIRRITQKLGEPLLKVRFSGNAGRDAPRANEFQPGRFRLCRGVSDAGSAPPRSS